MECCLEALWEKDEAENSDLGAIGGKIVNIFTSSWVASCHAWSTTEVSICFAAWRPQPGPQCWVCSGFKPTARTWSVSVSAWKGRLWSGFMIMQVWAQPLPPLLSFPSASPGACSRALKCPHVAPTVLLSVSPANSSFSGLGWSMYLAIGTSWAKGRSTSGDT